MSDRSTESARNRSKEAPWTDVKPGQMLEYAMKVLRKFAQFHCGPDREVTSTTQKKVMFGLFTRQETVEKIFWEVHIEKLYVMRPDGFQGMVPGATLDLKQSPELLIRVTLPSAAEYEVQIMAERKIPDVPQSALVAEVSEAIPANPYQLQRHLAGLVSQGVLVKRDQRLDYGG